MSNNMLLKIVLATLCVIGCAKAQAVQQSPVFLWGVATDAKPSLLTVPQADFANVLKPLLEKNTVVAFLEEDLSARDLSCHNVDAAQSCYAHLRNVSPKTYYASVENPVEVLRALTTQREHNSIDAEGKLLQPVDLQAGKLVFVKFETSQLQRGAALEAHDAAMQGISKQLSGNVVFLYLSASASKQNSIGSRVRRETAAQQIGTILPHGAEFLIYFTSLAYKDTNGVIEYVGATAINLAGNGSNAYDASLTTNTSKALTFKIKQAGGYYYMQDVVYNNVKFRDNDMNAPLSFSYHCGKLTLNAVSTLAEPSRARFYWYNLQFQASFGSSTKNITMFGDGWDCVYFFTPGILSALFTSIVLLLVLFTGICWMMDINTMDRFEDPKGKTITVNTATE